MATTSAPQDQAKWQALVVAVLGLLGVTAGLCTIFMLVVTVWEAWEENAHSGPEQRHK